MEEIEELWAVVEVFGRSSYAGRFREVEFLGDKFLELVIPEYVNRYGDRYPETTRLFAKGAIYSISQCNEDYARAYQQGYSASAPHAIATKDVPADPPQITQEEPSEDEDGIPFEGEEAWHV